MRILLLNQFYPPDVAPTGVYLHEVGRELVKRGHEVFSTPSAQAYEGDDQYRSRETLDGVQIRRVRASGHGRRTFLGKLSDYLTYATMLPIRLNTLPSMDLMVSLTSPPYVGFGSRWITRGSGTRHAHWIMDLYPDAMVAHGLVSPRGILAKGLQTLSRLQFQESGLVLSLGPFMKEKVNQYVPPRCPSEWVALWSDPELKPWPKSQRNSLRSLRGWDEKSLVLFYSGNMGLGHSFGEMLELAREKGRKGPVWAFAGGGKRRGQIENFARSNPDANIELHPYTPRDRLRESLCAADVHLVSLKRSWEGCMVPSKLQAIFAVGKPAIFVGGEENEISEWIRQAGAGWVVREGDIDALRDAVEEAKDPEERHTRGEAARAFAEAHFDRDRNCGRVADLLERAAHTT